MTSLFRRSSSNGSSRNNSSSTQELNNSRPARQVRRLEFNQAMEDFKTMFPNMDYDIIECVLRANNGAVDATIDQLLQMNLDSSGCDDSSDSDDSIPPEVNLALLCVGRRVGSSLEEALSAVPVGGLLLIPMDSLPIGFSRKRSPFESLPFLSIYQFSWVLVALRIAWLNGIVGE